MDADTLPGCLLHSQWHQHLPTAVCPQRAVVQEDVQRLLLGGGVLAGCWLGLSEGQCGEEHTGFSVKVQDMSRSQGAGPSDQAPRNI